MGSLTPVLAMFLDLSPQVNDSSRENYNSLMKETEEDRHK